MLSMTGYGEAQQEHDQLKVRVEIRSVNNRHLKLNCRLPDGYAGMESQLEGVVRQHVRRGALALNLYVERARHEEDYQVNEPLLEHYHRRISALGARLHDRAEIHLTDLLLLPGVVNEAPPASPDTETEWPLVEATLSQALERLNEMRRREGAELAADLKTNCAAIDQLLDRIRQRAPDLVKAYETRLLERINQLLADIDLQADASTVIREVALFADRVDVAEELVRLRSHLKQFDQIMRTEPSAGRKLEFLIQEMLRETNTIGSKANDAQIALHVVEIKTHIERLREMIQNVE
jgi:uncharacterized protein (TIGR00255 family)